MSEPCLKDDKISRLEKDVITINDRMNRHSEKIDKISDNTLVLETILRRLEVDGQEQKKTNGLMQDTLMSVQTAMSEITYNVKELNIKLDCTETKVDDTNEKVCKMDNDGKIGIMKLAKGIIPALIGAGVLALIQQLIQQTIK